MSRRPTARIAVMREQLAAALAHADLPMSTDDLGRLVVRTDRHPCASRDWPNHLREPGWTNGHVTIVADSCDGVTHQTTKTLIGPEVYPQLRALERAGVCERIYVDGHRRVYWRHSGPAPVDVAALEAAWEASP